MPPVSNDRSAAFRILDANLNRAAEGLRTLEDVARFRSQSELQIEFKKLRHQLTECSAPWDQLQMLANRNAEGDVGRTSKTPNEAVRTGGLSDITQAASQRVQQSLRTLEEVAKYLYPNSASQLESLRYRVYDLNSALQVSQIRDIDFLNSARLYVLVDCQLPLETFRARIREMSQAGVHLVQVRDKDRDAAELIEYTQAAIDAVDWTHTRIIVNDRADVAYCSRAWGLHVGQTDLSVSQARAILSSASPIGLSTHNLEQVHDAIRLQVDYIGCGPVFPSSTKSFSAYSGIPFLKEASIYLKRLGISTPAFAIGGIDADNLPQVIEAGFTRVAVSKSIWDAESPAREAEIMNSILCKAT
ncbi:MAG: thiamine phosphate synthase [Pirellula sp.]